MIQAASALDMRCLWRWLSLSGISGSEHIIGSDFENLLIKNIRTAQKLCIRETKKSENLTEYPDAIFGEHACLVERHAAVEGGLTAKRQQNTVRVLSANHLHIKRITYGHLFVDTQMPKRPNCRSARVHTPDTNKKCAQYFFSSSKCNITLQPGRTIRSSNSNWRDAASPPRPAEGSLSGP